MERIKESLVPLLLGVALYYAVFGGEYSLFEVRAARAALETERDELAAVAQEIDSLRAWADSLENDLPTIERIARERYGMIREGETLYRFVVADEEAEAPAEPAR